MQLQRAAELSGNCGEGDRASEWSARAIRVSVGLDVLIRKREGDLGQMKKCRILCREDFQDFAIGEFPYDPEHTAAGEYHYIVEEGYRGNWVDQVCNYTYNGTGPSWLITELDGVHYMEAMRIEKGRPHRMFPTLETGERLWKNYRATVRVQRLSQKGMAGLAFCMNNSIDTLVFALVDRERAELQYRHKEEVQVLASVEFVHSGDAFYTLSVDCEASASGGGSGLQSAVGRGDDARSASDGGSGIQSTVGRGDDARSTSDGGSGIQRAVGRGDDARSAGDSKGDIQSAGDTDGEVVCYIDGQEVLRLRTPLADRGGKIGITADCPTRFTAVEAAVTEQEWERLQRRKAAEEAREAAEMARHPGMRLWKKLDLHDFGTSRQVRFGHLTGTKQWFVVLAQMQKRVSRDAYGFISCLTAMDLDGNVLWQLGEPSKNSKRLGKVSADMPFQVYDIDGDGRDEVIVGRNFEIQILDGATGRVLRSARTPLSDDEDDTLIGVPFQTYAFERINPDGIRICNFRGKERPSDILIKDRYCRVYALDENLELLWKFKSDRNTGHCPLPVDINGDGRDEVLVGYHMLSADGRRLWSYPITDDHTDEIVVGKFRGDGRGYFACVSGTEGFFIGDFEGNIVARDRIGHAQRVSVARYCRDREDFQLAVTNFWGHQGVIYLYDADGRQLWELENEMNGNLVTPVNWDGSGVEMLLTNADAKRGGLLTGEGIRGVAFPDDGHPTLCCEAINLCGDEREELVCWDYEHMYIYTQEDNPSRQTYQPVKFPHYNASNYRGEYAYPNKSYLEFSE